MRFVTPRSLDDAAWRTGESVPGVAHFYGSAGDYDGRSKCWTDVSADGTRQATEDDRLCPDCECWYWQRMFVGSPRWKASSDELQSRDLDPDVLQSA